jgi:hypothetical protein
MRDPSCPLVHIAGSVRIWKLASQSSAHPVAESVVQIGEAELEVRRLSGGALVPALGGGDRNRGQ